ncbi:uncharacterized protein [Blastocystis hominis]|uniref:ATP-dependent DNA helicase n=1 Tax=Blastocystis hominis TaxID=12968 RepID=D8M0X0_BLAHO|nr:uncharacterized protein [Blastocystis hominis]CBK21709.2 unnamed protein product [Blastocystis hominis]|eukprot:XP_012895757.1 uncharacterized protein [Blastocystis hominis]
MDLNYTLRKIRQNEGAVDRWKTCSVLIIDEISMLDGRLFDTLEYTARVLRCNDLPFGGIQVVLCGDFFQLPPVGLGRNGVIFCFEARWWNAVVEHTMIMRKVFRQKDPALQALLREVRYVGEGERVQSRISSLFSFRLFAFNRNVDDYNQQQLDALPAPPTEYVCIDSGDDEGACYQLRKSCQAPSRLVLKRGAQVMLVKNLSVGEGLVNGCRGVVTSFKSSGQDKPRLPVVTFATPLGELVKTVEMQEFSLESGGHVVATRKQLPLKLAWGISIHKSQGMTIDLLEVDLTGVFEAGMTYVALSRGVRSDRMCVKGFRESEVKTNKKWGREKGGM